MFAFSLVYSDYGASYYEREEDERMDERYHLIMHERTQNTLEAIREYVEIIPEIRRDLQELKDRVDRVEMNTEVISVAVKEHSSELRSVKPRLSKLESAPT